MGERIRPSRKRGALGDRTPFPKHSSEVWPQAGKLRLQRHQDRMGGMRTAGGSPILTDSMSSLDKCSFESAEEPNQLPPLKENKLSSSKISTPNAASRKTRVPRAH